MGEGFKSGVLKDTAGLKSTAEGFRVRSTGNRLKVTDGPFTETKEIVGGYAMIEVASREEALKTARQFMELHRVHWPEFEGECEVRPVEEIGGPPPARPEEDSGPRERSASAGVLPAGGRRGAAAEVDSLERTSVSGCLDL